MRNGRRETRKNRPHPSPLLPARIAAQSAAGGKGEGARGFSLVEMLFSLGIVSIVLVIFFNVLSVAFTLGYKTIARSVVREEVSTVESLLTRDFRNADSIKACGIDGTSGLALCQIVDSEDLIEWKYCTGSTTNVCRYLNTTLSYKSSADVVFSQLTFEAGATALQTEVARTNVLITIIAGHANTKLNINNIVGQFSISTRNYEL